jgi:hypothetical protein
MTTRRLSLLICAAWIAVRTIAAQPQIADRSATFYQLHERLTDHDDKPIDVDVHRGSPVLVTMFYSSCPATCPLTIDTLRAIERERRHSHAWFERGHTVAYRFNYTRCFLSWHKRRFAHAMRQAIALHDVAPAKARVLNFDEHFAAARCGLGCIAYTEMIDGTVIV